MPRTCFGNGTIAAAHFDGRLASKRILAAVLSIALVAGSLPVRAGEAEEEDEEDYLGGVAESAVEFGRSIRPGEDGLSTIEEGKLLFPGMDDDLNVTLEDLFPGSGSSTTESLEDLFSDPGAIGSQGDAVVEQWVDDLESPGGAAYDVVTSTNRAAPPDISNDPTLWSQSTIVFDGLGDIADEFEDCEVVSSFSEGQQTEWLPDYQQCERIVEPAAGGQFIHHYDLSILRHVDGAATYRGCGSGCLEIWFGPTDTVSDATSRYEVMRETLSGGHGYRYVSAMVNAGEIGTTGGGNPPSSFNCKSFDSALSFEVVKGEAIESVSLEYGPPRSGIVASSGGFSIRHSRRNSCGWGADDQCFKDYTTVTFYGNASCELVTRSDFTSTNVTQRFRDNEIVSVSAAGASATGVPGSAVLTVRYDPAVLLDDNSWEGPGVAGLQSVADGFCTPRNVTCSDSPAIDADGCGIVDGVNICAEDFTDDVSLAAVASGVNPLCRRGTVSVDCGFYQGESCFTNSFGEEVCETVGEDAIKNSCGELSGTCGFVSSRCVDGAGGASGSCYVYEDTYDCGAAVSVPDPVLTRRIACEGAIRGMGEDFVNIEPEISTGFAEAMTRFKAIDLMVMDRNCEFDGVGDEDDNNCAFFEGEGGHCKKVVGGIVDCCKSSASVSLADYLTLAFGVSKLASATGILEGESAVAGAWQTLSGPVEDAWSSVTSGWSSWWNSMSGASTHADAATGLVAPVQQALMRETAEFVLQEFSAETVNLLFKVVGKEAAADVLQDTLFSGTIEFGGPIGSMIPYVGYAYTAYTVATTAVQILYQCEQEEYELTVNRDLKKCRYLGSFCSKKVFGVCLVRKKGYCCYNSPISRIIQEQADLQLGRGFGDAENPSCPPIQLSDLESLDWNQFDLSEWTAILAESGQLPTAAELNLEQLTGQGRMIQRGFEAPRDNALERFMGRTEQVDMDAVRNQAEGEVRGSVGVGVGEDPD